MIYDPRLTSTDAEHGLHYLAADSAIAHPDVPVLLAWSPESAPDLGTLRAIRSQAPEVEIAASAPADLVQQVADLLSVAPTPVEVTS